MGSVVLAGAAAGANLIANSKAAARKGGLAFGQMDNLTGLDSAGGHAPVRISELTSADKVDVRENGGSPQC